MAKKSNSLTEEQKEKIEALFVSSGRMAWTKTQKENYVFRLQSENHVSGRDIPLTLYQRDRKEIYNAIALFDPQLMVFNEHLRNNERHGHREIDFFKIPSLSDVEADRLLKNLKTKNYDLSPKSEWSVVGIQRSDEKIIVDLAKNLPTTIPVELGKDEIASAWKAIEKAAISKAQAGERLVKCKVRILAHKRTTVSVELDLTGKVGLFTREEAFTDEEGKKPPIEERNAERNQMLRSAGEAIGMDKGAVDKLIGDSEKQENRMITPEVYKSIHALNQDDALVIVKAERFTVDDQIETNVEEVAPDRKKLSVDALQKDLQAYFSQRGFLKGFLSQTEYKKYSTTGARYMQTLRGDDKARSEELESFFFITRDATTHEKIRVPLSYGDTDKVLEFARFSVDRTTGCVTIKSRDYSPELENALLSQIHRLRQE